MIPKGRMMMAVMRSKYMMIHSMDSKTTFIMSHLQPHDSDDQHESRNKQRSYLMSIFIHIFFGGGRRKTWPVGRLGVWALAYFCFAWSHL
jgi:hypothetical protein